MPYSLSPRSYERLQGVHPKLVQTVELAILLTEVDFLVVEGLRTIEKQKEYFDKGASRTMNSKHLFQQSTGFGHAVDLAPLRLGKIDWKWLDGFREIKRSMFSAAGLVGVVLRWGNDWNMNGIEVHQDPDETFADWPHFELRRF